MSHKVMVVDQSLCFPVSPSDVLHIIGDDSVYNHQITCILSFSGHLDAETLRKAVLLSMRSYPVLGCRFSGDLVSPQWELRNDLAEIALPELVEANDVEDQLHRFIDTSLDSSRDPQLQLRLIRSATGDTLCIKIHHASSDAGGFKRYLSILSSLYTDVSADAAYYPDSMPLARRDHGLVFEHLSLPEIKCSWDHSGMTAPKNAYSFPFSSLENRHADFVTACIPPESFQKIVRYAHARHVTINDILLTAFYRALLREVGVNDGARASLDVSVDMRRYATQKEALCNLTGTITPTIVWDSGDTFADTLRKVAGAMHELKGHVPGINLLLLGEIFKELGFEEYHRWILHQHGTETRQAPSLFSNVGRIEDLRFGSLEARSAYMVGPAIGAPGALIAVTTYKEKVTLAMAFYTPATEKGRVERFLQKMIADTCTSIGSR